MQQWIDYCLAKPGSTLSYPFDNHIPVIKVGTKMFALFGQHEGKPSISLKCEPFRAQSLREQFEEVVPGYHLNKKHWNTVVLTGSLGEEEIGMLIEHSYDLVFKSLTRAEKETIQAESNRA